MSKSSAYQVQNPDSKLSPFTGMSRLHWIDAGTHLLEGVFRHVKNVEDPIIFPKQSEVLYPKEGMAEWRFRAMEFEGLARTFMLAAPILADKPDLTISGIKICDYYSKLILRISDPTSPQYVGNITDLDKQYGAKLYQHTVEGAALTVGLIASQRVLWDKYTKAEKDQIAALLSDYAHNRTNGHNWRWFCAIMGSFLDKNVYPVDKEMIKDHLQNIMSFYAGDGWYRDHNLFDYYSPWAFQFYAPIWNKYYGYEHMPQIAAELERRHNELMQNYAMLFSRQGESLMWGRSSLYRNAASAPLAGAFLMKNPGMDPGFARRLVSGNLLQFISREDFWFEGIPAIGFYGLFQPMIQSYSCAASVFWVSKAYLAMSVPADSPFWTATENEGHWSQLKQDEKTLCLAGPGLTMTSHGSTGTCELRSSKVNTKTSDPNYTRLSYNSLFLWENDTPKGAIAQSYSIREYANEKDVDFGAPISMSFVRYQERVLYRQTLLKGWMSRIDLADIPIPGGVIRVDRPGIGYKHELQLGHYGLPHLNGQSPTINKSVVHGKESIQVSLGKLQLAMTILNGWESTDSMEHSGTHPEADVSTVIYAKRTCQKDYPGIVPLICVQLHGNSGKKWTEDELNPVSKLEILPLAPSGQPCGVKLTLRNGQSYTIDYGNIEGEWAQ